MFVDVCICLCMSLIWDLRFIYNGEEIEIVKQFSYLGIVFTSGGSCHETQKTLAGQALKAIFAMNKYLYKFMHLKPSHILDLFDKLISPILNYGSEVWGFYKAPAIEAVHLQFCKKIIKCQAKYTKWFYLWGIRED